MASRARLALLAPARAAVTAAAQDAVMAQLPAGEFTLARRYRSVPGLAGTITPRALDILRAHPMVLSIDLDETGRAHLPVSVPALRAHVVHGTLSVTGQGVTAAVLDTGIDVSDTELTVIAQQCFATAACPPKNTDTGPSAQDNDGHGTNVAAILASNGSVFAPGFAPAAKLVAVKVLDSRGSGFVSDWIAGLDYVSRLMKKAHLLRWRPRPHAHRTGSTARVRLSGAASHLGLFDQPAGFSAALLGHG